MNFLTTALIIIAVIVVCFAIFSIFVNEGFTDGLTVENSTYIANFFLFAIFLLLLAAVIKYVW